MSRIKIQPVPKMLEPILKQAGIRLKRYASAATFERGLKKFLKRNTLLHLATSRNDVPRCTPLEYRLHGTTLYILSEGGGKFSNLRVNKKISFGVAEPYDSEKEFFSAKGLQGWGTARVYSMKEHPRQFKSALQKMHIMQALKRAGQTKLPPGFNYRVIEITPHKMKYGNLCEGVYHIVWYRK